VGSTTDLVWLIGEVVIAVVAAIYAMSNLVIWWSRRAFRKAAEEREADYRIEDE
jgi:hypothetical protein